MNMAIRSKTTDLHVAMPAKVTSYDASAQTVDVIPCLNRHLPDGQGGFVSEALPKLADIPVCFPRGGGFFCSFPIAPGDYVLLVFAERNIAMWRSTGNQGDPGDVGTHTLDGAIAIPGVYPDANALSDASSTNLVLGKDGGKSVQVTPGGEVILGSNTATDFLIKGTYYRGFEDIWLAALSTGLGNLASALSSAGGQTDYSLAHGDITTASNAVGAIVTALGLYQASIATSLSLVTKTE